MSKNISKLYASIFFSSISRLMGRVAQKFDEEQPSVIQVKTELPKRIYCVMAPDLIADLFMNPSVGITKPPGLLPREDYLMKDSLVTDTGGNWKNKRIVMSPPF